MSVMLERARLIAKMVHLEETRRGGEPYFTHCDVVEEGVRGKGDIIESAAQLHDTLKNAKNPDVIRKLIEEYFPYEVLFLVETLTNDKNIYYSRYIDVVANNPKALEIKFQDMIHNTSDINNLTQKQIEKYRGVIIQIMQKGKEVPKILKERLKVE